MVKSQNTRVMITLSKEVDKIVNEVAELYGLTKTAAISMMIVVFHNSTARKDR